jgi:outer membrane lipoprotein-sorting protein
MILQETVFRVGDRETRQITAFDGKNGWVHAKGETRNMEDDRAVRLKEELLAFERLHTPDGWDGIHARYQGRETLDGKPVVHVVTTESEGAEWHWWFDAETWFLVKTAHKRREDGREELAESRYSDYRPVAGVQQAFKSEYYEDGKKAQTIDVQRVEINRGVKESIFKDRPGTRIGPGIY